MHLKELERRRPKVNPYGHLEGCSIKERLILQILVEEVGSDHIQARYAHKFRRAAERIAALKNPKKSELDEAFGGDKPEVKIPKHLRGTSVEGPVAADLDNGGNPDVDLTPDDE